MKSVLHGFLGTYTSRNSDYRGYWILGQLPSDLQEWTIDLLGSAPVSEEPAEAVHRLAARRFAKQVQKAGFTFGVLREATLQITRIPGVIAGWQGDFSADGQMIRFAARAVMDNGRIYRDERTVFVAPHDSEKERRRLEPDWGT